MTIGLYKLVTKTTSTVISHGNPCYRFCQPFYSCSHIRQSRNFAGKVGGSVRNTSTSSVESVFDHEFLRFHRLWTKSEKRVPNRCTRRHTVGTSDFFVELLVPQRSCSFAPSSRARTPSSKSSSSQLMETRSFASHRLLRSRAIIQVEHPCGYLRVPWTFHQGPA